MALNGEIKNGVGTVLFGGVLIWAIVVHARASRVWSNPANFESGRAPVLISPVLVFSDRGWTPAGLTARNAWFRVGGRATLILLLAAWIVLDLVF